MLLRSNLHQELLFCGRPELAFEIYKNDKYAIDYFVTPETLYHHCEETPLKGV
jgi:hypothetical protein